jgi:hypothetical protein
MLNVDVPTNRIELSQQKRLVEERLEIYTASESPLKVDIFPRDSKFQIFKVLSFEPETYVKYRTFDKIKYKTRKQCTFRLY